MKNRLELGRAALLISPPRSGDLWGLMQFNPETLVRDFLLDNFLDTAAAALETDIELRFPGESTFIDIRDCTLTFPNISNAELVLYFDSKEQAQRLFSGQEELFAAFMRGQVRSNGHIIWVFQAFAAFGKHAASVKNPG